MPHYSKLKSTGPFRVYRISNIINDKVYIGLTTVTVLERFRGHVNSEMAIEIFSEVLEGASISEVSRRTGFSHYCIVNAFVRLHGNNWRSLISDWGRTRTALSAHQTKRNNNYYLPPMSQDAVERGAAKRRGQKRTPEAIQRMKNASSRRLPEVWAKIAEARRDAIARKRKTV
jgi:hypothetical protein